MKRIAGLGLLCLAVLVSGSGYPVAGADDPVGRVVFLRHGQPVAASRLVADFDAPRYTLAVERVAWFGVERPTALRVRVPDGCTVTVALYHFGNTPKRLVRWVDESGKWRLPLRHRGVYRWGLVSMECPR